MQPGRRPELRLRRLRVQPGLGERDLVPGRRPRGVRRQRGDDGQPPLVLGLGADGVVQRRGKGNTERVPGRDGRHLQVSLRDQGPAVLDPPAEPVRRGAGRVVPVPHRDGLGIRVDLDPDRREYRFGLEQPGGRGAVGEDQAVDDEVAVVHGLAEVAAVAEVPLPRRGDLGDPVVDPLPDEPAVQPRVPVEQTLVVGQAAGAVAHGVAVLAEHHRQGPAVRVVPASAVTGSCRRPIASRSAYPVYIWLKTSV